MNKLLIFVFIILLIGNVLAECTNNQIDINSASLSNLDKLTYIGEVKAQAIIDSRPYESVDDLINVKGIGEVTLEKIKDQGLVCVDSSNNEEKETKEEFEDLVDEEKKTTNESSKPILEEISLEKETIKIEKETIILSPKDIKTEENNKILSKDNYAIYGFITFCILLLFLFMIKKYRYNKNEFRKR